MQAGLNTATDGRIQAVDPIYKVQLAASGLTSLEELLEEELSPTTETKWGKARGLK